MRCPKCQVDNPVDSKFCSECGTQLGFSKEEIAAAKKAIENYEKFLDLWKDADPIFPEIEDAKSRLKELRN